MKISKRQLARIVQEETIRHSKIMDLNESVREAYAEHLLLTYPNVLLAEGHITASTYTRACKMRMLNEAKGTNRHLEEAFFDDVKAMAKKVGGAAMEKGKELGKAGLEKAKEIGNTEIDTKKFAKDASRVGKEAGEMISGAGEGLWNALAPVAKKLGAKAADAAKGTVDAIEKNAPSALATAEKMIGGAVDSAMKGVKGAASTAAGAIGDSAHSLADMITKAKEGLSMEQQATKSPQAFLATYNALQQKLNDMGVPAQTPELAQSSLGVWESPDGQSALAAGAKKAGISPAELQSLTALYVSQSRYVDMATKASAQMSEGRTITRSQIRRLVRGSIKR